MKLALWFSFTIFSVLLALPAFAIQPTSLRQTHPLGWMYALPTGEMPGWVGAKWSFVEMNYSNIWNSPLQMQDKKTGASYEYTADFEQISLVAEFGWQIFENVAVSFEVPYGYRSGGIMDNFIENFHNTIGNRDFNRPDYSQNGYTYSAKTNSTDYYDQYDQLNGVANIKAKIKLWVFKWEGIFEGGCPCGLSVSAQVKAPTQDEKYGGTNGKANVSGLLHFGMPIGQESAFWLTAAYTRLAHNPAMPGWPLIKDHQMYEMNFDLGFSDEWGLLFMVRAESPFLDVDRLDYIDAATDPKVRSNNRASTGWNSIVRWQGAEALGLRYRPSDTLQFNFYAVEDWGIGPYDASDQIYCNGAPDINFVFQTAASY